MYSVQHITVGMPGIKRQPSELSSEIKTRKPSYRRDDRAMCPMYMGTLKIFLTTPTATFSEIFNGLLVVV